MKVFQFDSYQDYLAAQIQGSQKHRWRAAYLEREMDGIAEFWEKHGCPAPKILCHGARCGSEVHSLRKKLGADFAIGTDLNPLDKSVFEWDFNQPHPKWDENFDAIYSNSLDHSNDPAGTLATWAWQLKRGGFLFLRWSEAHELPAAQENGKPLKGGDCFAGDFTDYVHLLHGAGFSVKDTLFCEEEKKDRKTFGLIFCAQREEEEESDASASP